nr:MAG TPA: hypothetical protein [Caudoviricetes sp.]
MGYFVFFVRVHDYSYILLLCMVDTAASELAVSKYNHTLVDLCLQVIRRCSL